MQDITISFLVNFDIERGKLVISLISVASDKPWGEVDSTHCALQAAGEGGELLQHGVWRLLERLVHFLGVLRVDEGVQLVGEGLLDRKRVLLEILQGRGCVAAASRRCLCHTQLLEEYECYKSLQKPVRVVKQKQEQNIYIILSETYEGQAGEEKNNKFGHFGSWERETTSMIGWLVAEWSVRERARYIRGGGGRGGGRGRGW